MKVGACHFNSHFPDHLDACLHAHFVDGGTALGLKEEVVSVDLVGEPRGCHIEAVSTGARIQPPQSEQAVKADGGGVYATAICQNDRYRKQRCDGKDDLVNVIAWTIQLCAFYQGDELEVRE